MFAIFVDMEKHFWVRNNFPFYLFVAHREIISRLFVSPSGPFPKQNWREARNRQSRILAGVLCGVVGALGGLRWSDAGLWRRRRRVMCL